ncbi:hypothetical protein QQS21_003255 [Conoideocrella luteorostrata]|uniref:Uncharacterized protein n=1 Tax=Conoideocrella luteorostrata TaxID=1105319 RepID=A0AAJ0CW55_9HYPO|nr:hypothetical protein QQS21_003255 [Conoideocrella luteorostrata]
MLSKVLLSALFALPALAQNGGIPGILATITTDIRALNQSLTAFHGNDDALSGILGNSNKLKSDLNAGTTQARSTPPLVFKDSLALAGSTAGLARDSNETITTLISKKPDFDKIGASSIVVSLVKDLQTSAKDFSDAVVEKLPGEIAPVGDQLVGLINDGFARGIKAYS